MKGHILIIQEYNILDKSWVDAFNKNNFSFDIFNISEGSTHELKELKEPDVILLNINNFSSKIESYINYLKLNFHGIEIIAIIPIENIVRVIDLILKRGIFLYLPKPVDVENLIFVIKKAIDEKKKTQELKEMELQIFKDTWYTSPKMRRILNLISKLAITDATVLITGESGTGKEVTAKYIHSLSHRRNYPFVAVNISAIPENLIESELFGYTKGAFTGAMKDKPGLIEEANGGTLFLDEIGDLPFNVQVKLLRFLQDKSYRRVGDTRERYANVRIIAATNRNLQEEIKKGNFREDLFFRLNTFHIELPPLRERKECITSLVNQFIIKYNLMYKKNIAQIDKEAMVVLFEYDYPGNIRELEHIIEYAVVMDEDGVIKIDDLPPNILNSSSKKALTYSSLNSLPYIKESEEKEKEGYLIRESSKKEDKNDYKIVRKDKMRLKTLKEVELEYIKEVLAVCNNNHSEAAKILGISRATLWRKLKELEEKQ